MLKIGLEQEFFVLGSTGILIMCPKSIPHDSCGLLAEARGEPHTDACQAVYSVLAAKASLEREAKKQNLQLHHSDLEKIPTHVRLAAQRYYDKGRVHHVNLYNHLKHKNLQSEQTAGIHISFTNPRDHYMEQKKFTYNAIFNFVPIIQKFDRAFADEIKAAKRRPGFYEIKPDGRIEYRSLPATANMNKIIDILIDIQNKLED